jgi:hypothetical protein
MIKKFTVLLVFFLNISAFAQISTLSEESEISILTIGPGDNLYDKFGHSAFRVKDFAKGTDIVYNYGVYDFDTPNFYTKFARGKLHYRLAVSAFRPFIDSYIAQDRWVEEAALELTYAERMALFSYLQNNALPENQYYLYDFFYDNCATKIRDVLVEVLGEKVSYNNKFVEEQYTFRELIQKNVKANSWGSLGMDVAIGAVVDKNATAWEYQFLPEYVQKAAATATITNGGETMPLVKSLQTIYRVKGERDRPGFFMSPLFVFGIIGLLIIWITYRDHRNKTRSRYLDGAIFLVTGLIGVFLCLLWFATDHTSTANNYNLLWAFPLSLFLFTMISQKTPKAWLRRYVFLLPLLLIVLVTHWISGVQVYAIGLIPLLLALFIRYIYVLSFLKKQQLSSE